MAKGGGRGGMGGRGGRSAARRATRSASRSRSRTNRSRSRNTQNRAQESRDAQNLQSETTQAFDEAANVAGRVGSRLRGVGRNLNKLVKDRYKGGKAGRATRRTEAQRERERVHEIAKQNLDNDLKRFTDVDPNGDGILSPGQRGMLNLDAGPAMQNAARFPNARGADLYKAGIESHEAAQDALGDLLRQLADSYDFIMDVGQTFSQLAQDANNDN